MKRLVIVAALILHLVLPASGRASDIDDLELLDLLTLGNGLTRVNWSCSVSNDSAESTQWRELILVLIDDSLHVAAKLSASLPPMSSGQSRLIEEISYVDAGDFLVWFLSRNPDVNAKFQAVAGPTAVSEMPSAAEPEPILPSNLTLLRCLRH